MSVRLSIVLVLLTLSGSAAPAQTPALGRVMREKLTHSQKILEAIMTSDFAGLESHSAALSRVTQSSAWSVLNSPEYLRQSSLFVGAARDLVEAAKQHDLDAAAEHYVTLTRTCFQCHRYMKNARIGSAK